MSLINDVLRDLERRRETAPGALPGAVHERPGNRKWLWWLGGALLAGVAMHLLFFDGKSPQPVNDDRVAAAQTSRAGEGGGDATGALAPLLPREATATEASSDAGSSASGNAAEDFSNAPSAAVGARRPAVSAPVNENDKDPLQLPQTESPEDRAPAVTEGSEAAVSAVAVKLAQSAPVKPQSPPRRETGRNGDDGESRDGRIVIRRSGSSGSSTEDALVGAQRALARGQRDLAVSRLNELVDANPEHVEARLLLARALIEQDRYRAAEDLLEEGLEFQAEESGYAYLLGRLLMEQGRLGSARSVLEVHAPPVSSDAEYHLLMAATYRQAGDHDAATDVYRKVTESHPALGTAWVGLGLSLESAGDSEAARSAYREALRGDEPRAAAFARQRLAVMPSGGEAEGN